MLDTLAVENYRSLRRLVVPLRRCTVVTGPNGSGKSSLYRTLRLLDDSARNGAVNALAREGGLSSTMWAGPGRNSAALVDALRGRLDEDLSTLALTKIDGQTSIVGQELLDEPAWHWPGRH